MWGGVALSREQADEVVACESLSLRGARLDLKHEYDFLRGVVPRMKRLLTVNLSGTRLSDHHAPLLHELARPQRGLLSLDVSRNDLGPKCLEVLADCLSRHPSLQRLDVSRNLNLVRNMVLAKKLGGAMGTCPALTSLGVSFPEQVVVGDASVEADEAEAQARLRQALVDFYRRHNPEKVAHVETFLRRFRNVEGGIGAALRQKYPRGDLDAVERAAAACVETHAASRDHRELHRLTAKGADQQRFAGAFFHALVAAPAGGAGAAAAAVGSPRRGQPQLNHRNRREPGRRQRPSRLGVLELSSTVVSVRELFALRRLGVLGPRLSVLHLRGCGCGSPGAKTLVGFLRDGALPALLDLSLAANGIDDEGGCELARVLGEPAGAGLLALDLTSNKLGPATVCELALAVSTNTTLCDVRLSDGVLDAEGLSELTWALSSNPLSPLWRLLAEGAPPQAASADGTTPGLYYGDAPGGVAGGPGTAASAASAAGGGLLRQLQRALKTNWHRWAGTFHSSLVEYAAAGVVPGGAAAPDPVLAGTAPAHAASALATTKLIALQVRRGGVAPSFVPPVRTGRRRGDDGPTGGRLRRVEKQSAGTTFVEAGAGGSWLPAPRGLVPAGEAAAAGASEGKTRRGDGGGGGGGGGSGGDGGAVLWYAVADLRTDTTRARASGSATEASTFVVVWTTTIAAQLFGKQLPWRLVVVPTYHEHEDDPREWRSASHHQRRRGGGGDDDDDDVASGGGASFEIAHGHLLGGPLGGGTGGSGSDSDSGGRGSGGADSEDDDGYFERRGGGGGGDDVRSVRLAVAFAWAATPLRSFHVRIELGVPAVFLCGRVADPARAAARLFQLEGASLLADPRRESCVLAQSVPLHLTVCPLVLHNAAAATAAAAAATLQRWRQQQQRWRQPAEGGGWVLVRELWLPSRPFLLRESVAPSGGGGGGVGGVGAGCAWDRDVVVQWEWKMEALAAVSGSGGGGGDGGGGFEGTLHWELRVERPALEPPVLVVHADPTARSSVAPAAVSSGSLAVGSLLVHSSSSDEPIVSQPPGTGELLLSVAPEFLARDAGNGALQLAHGDHVQTAVLRLSCTAAQLAPGQALSLWARYEPASNGGGMLDAAGDGARHNFVVLTQRFACRLEPRGGGDDRRGRASPALVAWEVDPETLLMAPVSADGD